MSNSNILITVLVGKEKQSTVEKNQRWLELRNRKHPHLLSYAVPATASGTFLEESNSGSPIVIRVVPCNGQKVYKFLFLFSWLEKTHDFSPFLIKILEKYFMFKSASWSYGVAEKHSRPNWTKIRNSC